MSDMHDAVRTPPPQRDLTGTTVGRFNILARLGAVGTYQISVTYTGVLGGTPCTGVAANPKIVVTQNR